MATSEVEIVVVYSIEWLSREDRLPLGVLEMRALDGLSLGTLLIDPEVDDGED